MTNLILFLAAIVISWIVFNWLINVVKMGINTAFAIAILVLCLQIFLGITPREVWQEILNLPETIRHIFVK